MCHYPRLVDNPWNLEGYKMRYDSKQWYAQDSADPRPVRGRSFLLLCETRGSPQPLPSIAWYRDGRPLRNGRHFYIIVSINFAELNFRRFFISSDGKVAALSFVQDEFL